MNNFYETVLEVLKQDERFFTSDGELLRNAVYEAAMKMDSALIKSLYKIETTRSRFFTDVDGIAVFDKVGFGWVVNNKDFLPDSYTRYKNKIGLVNSKGEFISSSKDIELVFPYKDCVLEGGQTKEDQKRNEIFYNVTLAPDEVDRLLSAKVLCNAAMYTRSGKEALIRYQKTDNIIIKGNNLLALSSLLKSYEGKVKCIYIDPPYYFSVKKDEDTFDYNSNFKLSSWLVFMKNRLEIARRLLSDDGAIFVQISDDGVAELHRLMKDIFNVDNENNFINKITVKTKSPSGFASVNPGVFETAEYILAFAKHKKQWKYNAQYVRSEYDDNYKWVVNNKELNPSEWEIASIGDVVAKEHKYSSTKDAKKGLGEVVFRELIAQYALENADRVFRYTVINDNAAADVVSVREKSRENNSVIFEVKRDGQYTMYVCDGQEMAFYSRKLRDIDGEIVPSIQLSNIWTDTPYEGIASEGGVKLKGGKKPEKLIRRIIEMASNEGDLVLDFHLGSGTTAAVAHKLNRRYIGIEQLELQIEKILKRLTSVIDGEKSGISKAVKWQGGGSFVYCELAELNQAFADRIQIAKNDRDLSTVWKDVQKTGFVSCYINPKDIDETAEDIKSLSFEAKKRLFMELLDANQLYINYCDIDDETFGISDADKAFTKSFYGDK